MNSIKIAIRAIVLGLFMVSVASSSAETVSQKQASKIAEAFFNTVYGEYTASPKMVWNGRQLTTDRLFAPFYIYNHPRGGFVIVSADSKAYPILGYSRTAHFDRSRLADDDNELLKKYAREIELIRYDSRIPDRAVAAWQNMPLFINKVLSNPYDTPEFEALKEPMKETLEAIDRRMNGVMLPSAVEFDIYNPERFRDYTLDDVFVEAEEEIPFSFYEDFLALTRAEENERLAALDEILSPTKPVVEFLGGAHFSIKFPVQMKMAVIYSLQGLRLIEKYYSGTDTINLDLSSLPAGFYPMLALGEDGRIYGFKLYR